MAGALLSQLHSVTITHSLSPSENIKGVYGFNEIRGDMNICRSDMNRCRSDMNKNFPV